MATPTVTLRKQKAVDNKLHVQGLFTPSTSYLTATPSETYGAKLLGLKAVDSIYIPTRDLLDPSVLLPIATQKRGFSVTLVTPSVTAGNVDLRMWEEDGTEVADAQNLSAETFYIVFVGT